MFKKIIAVLLLVCLTASMAYGAYEDFTTYNADAIGIHITVDSATKVSWNDIARNENSWIVKDKGVGHFTGDFTHKFEIQVSDASNCSVEHWALANVVDDSKGIIDASGDAYFFDVLESVGTYYFRLQEYDAGSLDQDFWTGGSASTTYYITITRVGTTLTAVIRTGSHTGTTQDTLVVTVTAFAFRYIYCVQAYNSGSSNHMDGYTENMDLGEAAEESTPIANLIPLDKSGDKSNSKQGGKQ